MKNSLLLICLITIGYTSWGQGGTYDDIKRKFTEWDPIRGAWVFESVNALSNNNNVPDRTFPEQVSPYELFSLAPKEIRQDIQQDLEQSTSSPFIDLMSNLVNATLCSSTSGRSFGDPHISTLDNTSFSFQTVGEFVMTKNSNNKFEVQARQKPQQDDFSLNTAVAVNMYGDRVAYYSEDLPDNSGIPLWINGQPVRLEGRTYYLAHGGTIRLVGRNYIIAGPLGEEVIIDNRSSGSMRFMNLTVNVPKCYENVSYTGVLGNANGNSRDDFDGNSNQQNNLALFGGMNDPQFSSLTQDMETRYLISLTKEFAEAYRVTSMNTLFDYRPGQSTESFTNRDFPKFHRTFNNIPNQSRTDARNRCREMGVVEAEMNGCIYDSYYLNLPPNPIPTPPPATEGVVLNKLERPVVNTNSVIPVVEPKNPGNGSRPTETKPINAVDKPSVIENKEPSYSKPHVEEKPSYHESSPKPSYSEPKPSYSEPKPSKPAPSPSPSPQPSKPAATTIGKGKN